MKLRFTNSTLSRLFAIMVVLALTVISASAADFRVIDTAQLKEMTDSNQKFMLVDARTKEEYDEAHIKNAVSLPEKEFEKMAGLLPADKSALIVMYCNGVKCGKSKKLAAKAAAAGFTNIILYGEGFPVWEEKGMPIYAGPGYSKKIETTKMTPVELKKMIDINSGDFVIVDVRDEQEYAEGHIPGAVNIPVEVFATKSEILPKEKKIIVYCNTGGRSYNAYRKLMKLGYANIFQTLFADWKEAKYEAAK
ncbi:MAG: sulfurtransferase [Nitrospirae bacterium]|nr:sulfurtransferase [Nitrospirota bacterium]